MLGKVEDTTGVWNSHFQHFIWGIDRVYFYEFEINRIEPVTRIQTLLAVANVFAQAAATDGYDIDVFGVLCQPGNPSVGINPIFQVAFRFVGLQRLRNTSSLDAALAKEIERAALGTLTAKPKALRSVSADDPETRYFSNEGGLAPLFFTRGGQVQATKAASDPSPKQLLFGDARNLDAAVPFKDGANPGPGPGPGPNPTDPESDSFLVIVGLLGLAALGVGFVVANRRRRRSLSPKGPPTYTTNKRRSRRKKSMIRRYS